MKIRNLCFLAVFFCAFAGWKINATASQDDFLIVEGVITVQSDGSFLLESNGKSEKYNTGVKTVYDPESYRTSVGDVVKVWYAKTRKTSGEIYFPVSRIAKIKSTYDDYKNEVRGKITYIKNKTFSSYKAIMYVGTEEGEDELEYYINGDTEFNGGDYFSESIEYSSSPSRYQQYVGNYAKITVERVPKNRGNGYIYVAKRVDMVKDRQALYGRKPLYQDKKQKMISDAADLLKAGAISEEEFSKIKKKILAED